MPEQSNDYRIIVFGAGSVGKSEFGAAVNCFLLLPETLSGCSAMLLQCARPCTHCIQSIDCTQCIARTVCGDVLALGFVLILASVCKQVAFVSPDWARTCERHSAARSQSLGV